MSEDRTAVLNAVRRALKRGEGDRDAESEVDRRLAEHPRNLIPARGQLPLDQRIALFIEQAEALSTSVTRVGDTTEVPEAIADYLKANNLPAELRLAPHPDLEALPWDKAPLLKTSSGAARHDDPVSVTAAFGAVAETGTLLLHSGPGGPTTLNFLPDTNIVVLRAERVEGDYETVWDQLRQAAGDQPLPRTVNFISGPSRTADIEQTIQLGAHGPRRLHVVLVGGPDVQTT